MAFVEREKEILKTIRHLVNAGLDFIVVGGYAVSALSRHRFSVDCDMVISKEELARFEELLEEEGYKKDIEKDGFDDIYGGAFIRYKKEVAGFPVSIDLLVNGLVCRATDAVWGFEYINKNIIETNITSIETSVRCEVPEKELMIAFKIHSGRRTDVRDVVMLNESADLEKVLSHLRRGNSESLKDQVNAIITSLEDKNLINSLKGVFTLSDNVERQIQSTKKFINAILKVL